MSQLLVSGFLTAIFNLSFLSLVKIWNNVALVMMKQDEQMIKKEYRKPIGFYQKRKIF